VGFELNLYRAFVEDQEVFEGTWSAKFNREEGDRTTVMVYTSP